MFWFSVLLIVSYVLAGLGLIKGVYWVIFSSSSMKCSKRLVPRFQNVGSATFRLTSLPISSGEMLLPADSAALSLGTNALPSCRYRSYSA